MKSFEFIAKETGLTVRQVMRTYYKAMGKLKAYARDHPEVKVLLEQDVRSTLEPELLACIYDKWGREKDV